MKYLALLVFLSATPVSQDPCRPHWIVWNVGQGQWASYIDLDNCFHFDMGGERSPLKKVAKTCKGKRNFLLLSHWDWDHLSFVKETKNKIPSLCLLLRPLGKSSKYKERIIAAMPACPEFKKLFTIFSPQGAKDSNSQSHVIRHRDMLIPGDSTKDQEKIWIQNKTLLKDIRVLLLGHHGSKTSTSQFLLQRLPGAKMSVASARFRRYGHPHPQVIFQLKLHKIALLRTEDWGDIWFEQ